MTRKADTRHSPVQTLPVDGGRSLARDLRRAFVHPRDAWNGLRRWALLARSTDLPYAELVRYRRELREDREFQGHLARYREAVPYVFPGASVVYALVRALKPGVIVETGVASGISSAHMLRAMAANGRGMLYSIDLPNVQKGSILPEGCTSGWMVPEGLRGRWALRIGDSRALLPDLLEALDPVDVFLHDGDHSYENMRFEFEHAFPRLVDRGVLLSDDVHLHSAWDDFCAQRSLRATRMGELGVARKRSTP